MDCEIVAFQNGADDVMMCSGELCILVLVLLSILSKRQGCIKGQGQT